MTPISASSSLSGPVSQTPSLARRAVAGLAATLIIAVAAHVAFPLPFTPVPFTLQPLAVLAIGLWLGPLDGPLALLAYLAEGALGLPVFSPTGLGGVAQILGPTGGYLMAYPAVAALAGGLVRTLRSRLGSFSAAALACSVATVVLFCSGATWLAALTHMSAHAVWMAAVVPFLPGEAIKVLAAAGGYRALSGHATRAL